MSTEIKAKKEPLPYNAQQRVQAVLSVWTERRRPREVCQELGISATVLSAWEKRGVGGDAQGAGVADPFGTGTGAQPQIGAVVGAPSLAAEGTPGQVGKAAGQAA